jgi:Family of unknown function (DUF6162)
VTPSDVTIVRPRGGARETALLVVIIALILGVGSLLVEARQVDNFEPRLFGWQISAFYDLNPTDQAIYNALVTASDELWWIHGGRLEFPDPDQDPWPTVEELDKDFELPPFVKDLAWSQQGKVQWRRIAEYSFEGSTVYYGGGGDVPGQSAYLLVQSHQHKGASFANGAAMWVHPDPNAPPPTTMKTDSLIVHGWKEIIPYSGATEKERLKGS